MRRAFFLSIGIGVVACSLNVSGTLPFEPPPPPPDGGIPDASLPPGSDGAIPEDAGGDVFGAPFPPSNVDGGLVDPGAPALDAVTAIDTSTMTVTAGGVAYGVGAYPAGVTFTIQGDYAVLSAGTITLGPGDVALTGTRALVVLAAGDLVVDGAISAFGVGIFPGPGGFSAALGPGAGANGSTDGMDDTGGGGAGHGTPGAKGTKTDGAGAADADGGAAYDLPLAGGSGGGAGPIAVLGVCGSGGAGGGALQLYAARALRITAQGIVNAGGAGGLAGCLNGAGGGGGSGGTVWLEAPTVDVAGIVAANGGGGGGATRNGGDPGGLGENGRAAITRADGGVGGKVGGPGEALGGGRGGALEGPPTPSTANAKEESGGGGGAVGRIRVRARMFIVDGGVLSPAHEVR